MTVQSNWSFLRSEIKVLRASLGSSHLTATRLFYQPGRWNMLKLKRCGHVVAVGSYTKFSRLDWDENHVWTPWISTFLTFFYMFVPSWGKSSTLDFFLSPQPAMTKAGTFTTASVHSSLMVPCRHRGPGGRSFEPKLCQKALDISLLAEKLRRLGRQKHFCQCT